MERNWAAFPHEIRRVKWIRRLRRFRLPDVPRFIYDQDTENKERELLLILLDKFLLTLCPPCLCGEYPLLPSLLWLVPGGQILLHEICSLLWRESAVQHLRTRVPKIVFVVRIAVAREDLIRAPERGRSLFPPTGEFLSHRVIQGEVTAGQRKETGQRIRIQLGELRSGHPS